MSVTSDYGSAFRRLFDAISLMEGLSSRASSAFFTPQSTLGSPSQVTANSVGSQETVIYPPGFFGGGSSAPSSGTESTKEKDLGSGEGPSNKGLPLDNEGKETRAQMLARRRKDCKADEVDVALAPVMKLTVPYCFYPEQYKRFRSIFPRVNVDSGLSYTHHDHPVAHTATLLGIRHIQSMLRPGEAALDLHGNPTGNENFNRFQESRIRKRPKLPAPAVIDTLVENNTALDAVRKMTKWGDQFDSSGKPRFFEMPMSKVATGLYSTFISVNTLYYYSMYEVCGFLNKHKGSRLLALVNYSPEQSGTLYGELKFSKNGGMTTQTSPNGEKYHHPDVDQWFQTYSFRPHFDTAGGGIAWTSTCIGGPLYVIQITACDFDQARFTPYDPPGAPVLKIQKDRSFLGLVRIGGTNVRLRITNHDLASELRHFMTFRDRNNPETFLDLVVKARRVTGKDIVDGSRQFYVNDGELQDHIVYAYAVDAPGELELLDGMKILQGDVFAPLASALKMDRAVQEMGYLEAMFGSMLFGKKEVVAFKQSTKPVRTTDKTNSGGLLPIKRT